MTGRTARRHLTPEGLSQYLDGGAPALVEIPGNPQVFLVIEPASGVIGIRLDRQAGDAPSLEPFKHFTARTLSWHGNQWVEIQVAPGVNAIEAYPVLCAIADRVQLEGLPTGVAALQTIEGFRELLAGLGRLSDDTEVGLFGELLALRHLIRSTSEDVALEAWCGPEAEEHDFVLPLLDLEVKTTTSEARMHWISDLHQLVPSAGRPLFLLSIQITTGGATGFRLPQLIALVRDELSESSRPRFDAVLADRYLWNPSQIASYQRKFHRRTQPTAYLVDNSFPAITPQTLAHAGLDEVRFRKVRYLLDVSGLDPTTDAINGLDQIGASLP